MRSVTRPASVDSGRAPDDAQKFFAHPPKAPKTCPARPPANIPGASGKMYPPEKHPRNEKLKSLKEQSEMILDALMDSKTNLESVLVQTHYIMIELLETLMEPEDTG